MTLTSARIKIADSEIVGGSTASPSKCPVSLALSRLTNNLWTVYTNYAYRISEDPNKPSEQFRIQPALSEWIRRYDQPGRPTNPGPIIIEINYQTHLIDVVAAL